MRFHCKMGHGSSHPRGKDTGSSAQAAGGMVIGEAAGRSGKHAGGRSRRPGSQMDVSRGDLGDFSVLFSSLYESRFSPPEGLDDVRIELIATFFQDDVPGHVVGERFFVDTL